jgi:hypothetical protein
MAQQYGNASNFTVQMAGPFGGHGTGVKLTTITLYADKWKGATSPYSQVVDVEGVSVKSMVNLQPSVEQLEIFHDKDLAFVTENEEGVVTVFAVGDKPANDYSIQASILEVTA